jgi:RNA polymerase sigma-70 factor, ECF subfamily
VVTFHFDTPVDPKGRLSMTPDSDVAAAPRDSRVLVELLREQREKFLTFVRWRSSASVAARRDPEDILQVAFIRARERWADFERSGMALESWFYRIILNALLDDHDYQTRQRRDCRAENVWPDHSSMQFACGLHDADTSPSETLSRQELKERIERVLAMLPHDHQQIMVLVHYGELSKEQAAALLGIESNAARQRYARARFRFRDAWKSLYGEEGFAG